METTSTSLKGRRKSMLRRLSLWTLAWVGSEALAVFGHKYFWDENLWVTGVVILINLFFGLGMVLTYRNLMNLMDELERKIQLESMGLTLGLTMVFGIGYSVLDITNLIPWDAEIGILIFFTGGCYIVSMIINTRRYC